MEPALKQRLLGAAVIVALAVIIIPFLLDGSGTDPVSEVPLPPEPKTAQRGPVVTDDHVPQQTQEPPAQVIDQYSPPPAASAAPEPTAPAPVPAEPVAPPPQTAAQSVPTPAPAPVPAPEPPAAPQPQPAPPPEPAPQPEPEPPAVSADASGSAPHAWVVQVGSFGEQDKAMALRDRLRKQQFKAFVERFQAGNGQSMYRVRVGPVPERPEAEQLAQALETKQSLKGFVTRHP